MLQTGQERNESCGRRSMYLRRDEHGESIKVKWKERFVAIGLHIDADDAIFVIAHPSSPISTPVPIAATCSPAADHEANNHAASSATIQISISRFNNVLQTEPGSPTPAFPGTTKPSRYPFPSRKLFRDSLSRPQIHTNSH